MRFIRSPHATFLFSSVFTALVTACSGDGSDAAGQRDTGSASPPAAECAENQLQRFFVQPEGEAVWVLAEIDEGGLRLHPERRYPAGSSPAYDPCTASVAWVSRQRPEGDALAVEITVLSLGQGRSATFEIATAGRGVSLDWAQSGEAIVVADRTGALVTTDRVGDVAARAQVPQMVCEEVKWWGEGRVACVGGGVTVFDVRLSDGEAVSLPAEVSAEAGFDVSDDGRRLVYAATQEAEDTGALYVRDVAEGTSERIEVGEIEAEQPILLGESILFVGSPLSVDPEPRSSGDGAAEGGFADVPELFLLAPGERPRSLAVGIAGLRR